MDDKKRKRNEEVYSKRIRAGRKRTYFIDVKTTRNNDYYITITESKKDFKNPNYYIKHKIFLYKEDFNKFIKALSETVDYVKTDLLPDYPFDMYDREEGIYTDDKEGGQVENPDFSDNEEIEDFNVDKGEEDTPPDEEDDEEETFKL